MTLVPATRSHLEELMTWFKDEQQCRTWGGPRFRFPYNHNSFKQDLQWGVLNSMVLLTDDQEMVGFGQLYEKYGRIHLARLIVHPEHRRKGYGRELIHRLLLKGPQIISLKDFSLNVYKDNQAAITCYQGFGFKEVPSPETGAGFDRCSFMVLEG